MATLLLGFALNYAVNALFGKDQEGPRLTDLKLQGSSYGAMEPIVYGEIRLAGNVIWQTDLTEHKNTSSGKGGPKVTTFTYTASFDVLISGCTSKKIVAIYADKQLIWERGNAAFGAAPCVFYYGEETQLPDPTEESILGVGNVPAYRGVTRAVFTDWLLSNYGNRIPTLEFVEVTNVGTIPQRVYTYSPRHSGPDFSNQAFILNAQYDTASQALLIGQYSSGLSGTMTYKLDSYDLDGTHIASLFDVLCNDVLPGGVGVIFAPCVNNAHLAFGAEQGAGSSGNGGWYYDGQPVTAGMDGTDVLKFPVVSLAGDLVYAVGGTGFGYVARFATLSNIPAGSPDEIYFFTGGELAANRYVLSSDDGNVWVSEAFTATLNPMLWKFDDELNLIHSWVRSELPTGFTSGQYVVYGDVIAFQDTSVGQFDTVYRINADFTFTFVGKIPCNPVGTMAQLGDSGLVLVPDGVISLEPPSLPVLLSEIVSDISVRCGLSPSQIDVTELTDLVPGYLVGQQMPGRDMISPLQTAYFFDGVESDNQVVFVKRGAPSAITIPDDDLAAVAHGGKPPALLGIERTQEVELPQIWYTKYLNPDAAYQTGTQQSQRLVTSSQLAKTVDLAIAFDDAYGKKVSDVNLIEAWIRRDKYMFYTVRKYAVYEPTDVVTAHGRTMQITDKQEVTDTTIKFEGVGTLSQLYVQTAVAGEASGYRPPPPPPGAQATNMLLLDIPLVTDADATNGFYAAMAGASNDSWSGGGLYKSVDGSNFSQLLIDQTGDVIGTAGNALGNFLSGNIFDESNSLTFNVGPGGGEMASYSQAAVLNGAGRVLVGSEIIGVKNAVLTSAGVYTCTGLLRGQRGTEQNMVGHVANENVVILPASANPAALFSEIGLPRYYEAVTLASAVSGGTPQVFTNTGVALRCYAPVQLGGGTDASGNVTMTAVRRTRIGARFMAPADVPLSEATPLFVWEIRDATYANVAKIVQTTSVTVPLSATFSSADQLALFSGSQQQKDIFFSVAQVGANGIGQRAYGVARGAGSSNTAIIVPIPPYASPAPTGGGCTLPTVTSSFNWATPATIYSPTIDDTVEWVISFTTGLSVSGTGTLTFAELGGGPIQRTAVLSTSPCGPPLTPSCSINSTTITFPFYMQGNPSGYYPTLAPSTTYYVSILSSQPGVMYGILEKPH